MLIRNTVVRLFAVVLTFSSAAIATQSAFGVVLSYDGFATADYTVGSVSGQAYAGTGYAAAGTWDTTSDFVSGGLVYPDLVTTPGYHVNRDNGSMTGNLSFSRDNTSTDTVYYSFLGRTDNTGAGGWAGLNLFNGATTENLGVGKNSGSNNYSAFQPIGDIGAPATALDTDTHLFVVRIDYAAGAGGDVATIWLDPDVTLAEGSQAPGISTTLAADDQNFDQFRMRGDEVWEFDEIRFATTFAEVTPFAVATPEPATLALAFVGLAFAGLGRYRRTRVRC